MTTATVNAPAPSHTKRWPAIVVTLLLGHVCLMFIAAYFAVSYAKPEIDPDYYKMAEGYGK